jgi:integrase
VADSIRKKHWTLFKVPEKSGDIWQMRAFIKDHTGRTRKVRKSTGTADPAEADRIAGEIWVAESRRAGQSIPVEVAPLARVSVVDAGANWITTLEEREKAGEFREKYASRFNSDLDAHLIHMWSYVDEIPFDRPEAMEAALRKRHKANAGGSLGWNSIVRLAVSVRMLVEHCMRVCFLDKTSIPELRSYLPENIGKLIEKEKRPVDALTRQERTRLLNALKSWDPHDGSILPKGTHYRFYVTMHYTLLRRGEAWAITPAWIDSKTKLIRIPADHSKSGEVEEVPLHPKAAQALKEQIATRGSLERDVPIFGKINVRKAFAFAIKKAKITKVGITAHHHARHSAATIAAGETMDVLALQALGRWRSLRMVERYTHPKAERARPVMSKL